MDQRQVDYVLGAGDRSTPERKGWEGREYAFQSLVKLEVLSAGRSIDQDSGQE
jgi:hypothetical protein